MDYYRLLQLEREPFSNSPDPDYFYPSKQHLACLQQLELAVRLKRGLNIVIGDVGTGKTTLCRQILRKFADEPHIESHLILDPSFDSTSGFLHHIHELICGQTADAASTDLSLKESIKQHLFHRGVDQENTVALIIDEGQKITDDCLEILRELLNFETNTYKLLQIIIFAQLEFNALLEKHANFSDRVNLLHHLSPMDFNDTRQMVKHRIKMSSSGPKPRRLFTRPALWAIYRSSRGYPRRIIHLCHQSMLAMIIQNRSTAGWALIRSCRKRLSAPASSRWRTALAAIVLLLIGAAFMVSRGGIFDDGTIESQPVHKIEHGRASAPEMPAPPDQSAMAAPPMPIAEAGRMAVSPQASTVALSVADASPPSDTTPAEQDSPAPTETLPEKALASASPFQREPNPPERLGSVIVKPGDNLVSLIDRVYGTQHNSVLRAVIEVNAHIADPNVIDIGNVLTFPALQQPVRHPQTPVYRVALEDQDTLAEAVEQVHHVSRQTTLPVQLIPFWSKATGLKFKLLIKKTFAARQEAEAYTDALPRRYTGTGQVLADWPDGTVFYANPYAGIEG